MTTAVEKPNWKTDVAHHAGPYSGAHRSLVNLLNLGRGDDPRFPAEPQHTLDGIIHRGVLRRLLSALQQRDPGTVRHARRVALLAVGLAEHLGWEGQQLKVLEVAALLHDIGKIGVPDSILFKPSRLSPEELDLMALHYGIALDVLQACRVDPQILRIVGESQISDVSLDSAKQLGHELHLGARILALADAYESLSGQRTYRPARTHAEIMPILEAEIGKQFDGNVVSALTRYVELHGLPFAAHTDELDEMARQQRSSHSEDIHDANEIGQTFASLYVLESLYDGFCIVDADLRMRVWNRGAENLLGYSVTEMYGKPWTRRMLQNEPGDTLTPVEQVLQTSQPLVAEVTMHRQDGRQLTVELQAIPLCDQDGRVLGVLQIYRDRTRIVTRRSTELNELKLAASRDALTSVANRGELETQLAALTTNFAQGVSGPFSVIFADADHFKNVNDTYGHAVGDQVLIDIARLLQQETYSGELVARYGGEEFVILCPETDLEDGLRKAERIRNAIRKAQIGGVEKLRVTASFGVSVSEPGDSVESVLRRADKALYQAKHSGRDRTCTLTNAALLAEQSSESQRTEHDDPFRFETSFAAVVGADMVVYKLSGFLHDHQATLGKVTKSEVVMQTGGLGWFGYWGSRPKQQAVEIQLTFSEPVGGNGRQPSTPRTTIRVTVRPLGWVRNREIFQYRAFKIVNELRQYCAGD